MPELKRVTVERHPLLYRILHWLIVAEAVILLVTGAAILRVPGFDAIDYFTAGKIHVYTGLAWLATAIFFLYYFVVSGEFKWFNITRIPYALKYLAKEAKAWATLKKVEEPIRYDPEKKEYVEKIVPTEVLAWWVWFILGVLIALTGLALLYPRQLAFMYPLCEAVVKPIVTAFGAPEVYVTDLKTPVRMAHMILALLVVFFGLLHIYSAFIFKMVKSIITGKRDEPVVEKKPETPATPAPAAGTPKPETKA